MPVELFVLYADGPAPKFQPRKSRFEFAYRDAAGAWQYAECAKRIHEPQWLVPGERVPGEIDPGNPRKAEVLWEEIVPLEQRILANDRALSGHHEVYRELKLVRRAMIHERVNQQVPDNSDLPEYLRNALDTVQALESSDYAEDLAAFMATRPQQPLIDDKGRLRGEADLISRTISPPPGPGGDGAGGHWGKRIYRVWLYGYDPYPVLDKAWIGAAGSRSQLAYGRVPVSVSQTDRNDVRFHWDEYDRDPGEVHHNQVMKEMGRALRDANIMVDAQMKAVFEATPPEQRRFVAETMIAQGTHVPDELFRDSARIRKLDALLERGVVTIDEYQHYLTKL